MVESTAAGTASSRNIVVGDSLASVKERFPTDGAEGERLYRITVPVKRIGNMISLNFMKPTKERMSSFIPLPLVAVTKILNGLPNIR